MILHNYTSASIVHDAPTAVLSHRRIGARACEIQLHNDTQSFAPSYGTVFRAGKDPLWYNVTHVRLGKFVVFCTC